MKSVLAYILLAATMGGFTLIFQQNNTIDEAYQAYNEKEYQEVIDLLSYLVDSLEYMDAGVQLNIAHSSYHQDGFSGSNGTNLSNREDSIYLSSVQRTFYEYSRVWEAEPLIASRGYHQAGMVTFKSRIVNNKLADEAALINSSLDYFKNALRKDPDNEKARYNYELLKKYKEFPEMLMERVRRLVELRLYVDAFNLLAPYAQGDSRFAGYAEYAKRLGDIAKIEVENERN